MRLAFTPQGPLHSGATNIWGGGEYLFQQRLCAQVEVIIHPARTGSVIAALGGDPAGPL